MPGDTAPPPATATPGAPGTPWPGRGLAGGRGIPEGGFSAARPPRVLPAAGGKSESCSGSAAGAAAAPGPGESPGVPVDGGPRCVPVSPGVPRCAPVSPCAASPGVFPGRSPRGSRFPRVGEEQSSDSPAQENRGRGWPGSAPARRTRPHSLIRRVRLRGQRGAGPAHPGSDPCPRGRRKRLRLQSLGAGVSLGSWGGSGHGAEGGGLVWLHPPKKRQLCPGDRGSLCWLSRRMRRVSSLLLATPAPPR